jgi:hypothetical protein
MPLRAMTHAVKRQQSKQQNTTQSFQRHDVSKAIATTVEKLTKILEPGLKILRMPDGSIVAGARHKQLLETSRDFGNIEKILTSFIKQSCENIELSAPGSSHVFMNMLRSFLSMEEHERVRLSEKDMSAYISKLSSVPNERSLENIMRSQFGEVAEIVIEAMKLAGSECKIFIEPTASNSITVEKTNGHMFTSEPDPSMLKNGKWSANAVKCLLIDGIVASVSEIDMLLERCHAEKIPMVIFARGFCDDVIATLRANFARKTLNVVPVVISFDIETANVLSDIAAVIGADVVSSLKGELISAVKLEDIKSVGTISCFGRTTAVICEKPAMLNSHINKLLDKRKHEPNDVVKKVLDKRLRSLSSSAVVIKLNDASAQGSKMMLDIDECLRLAKNILIHGLLYRDSIKQDDTYAKIIKSSISQECPTTWAIANMHESYKLANTLASIGLIVSVDF